MEEVLSTTYRHPGSSDLGAAVLTMFLGQAFFLPSAVPLFPENAVQLGGEGKIVPFDTAGLFIGVPPNSLCGASAAVRLRFLCT